MQCHCYQVKSKDDLCTHGAPLLDPFSSSHPSPPTTSHGAPTLVFPHHQAPKLLPLQLQPRRCCRPCAPWRQQPHFSRESADSQLRASASIVRSTQRNLANLLRSQHNDVAPARVDGSRLMENAKTKRKLVLTTLETAKIDEATHLLGMTLKG